MPHDIHSHLKNYKHTGPWVSLAVCYLGDLDLRFFSYIRIQNGVGFCTENMSYEKRVIWEFVADGRAGYRNVYIVAASPKWKSLVVLCWWLALSFGERFPSVPGTRHSQFSQPENWPTPWREQYPTMNWEEQWIFREWEVNEVWWNDNVQLTGP